MNDMVRQMMLMMGSYLAVILIGYFLINFMSQGFLTKFLRVKASRGKKILVHVWGKMTVYFVVGYFDGADLVYKGQDGKQKRLNNVPKEAIYRKMGVAVIEVDDEKNAIVDARDFKSVQGFDAVKTDSLIQRALMLGKDDNPIIIIIILILVILIFFGLIAAIVLLVKNGQLLNVIASKPTAAVIA